MARKKTRPLSGAAGALSERERGMAAFRRGEYPAAIAAWSAHLRREPDDEPLRRALAEAHFRRACGNLKAETAREDFEAACRLMPADPLYLYHLGLAHHRDGDLPGAIETYRESIRLDPYHFARTAYVLCLAVAESGGDPRAEDVWSELSIEQQNRLWPSHPALVEAIARMRRGEMNQVEEILQRALNHSLPFAQNYLGVMAWRRGDKTRALSRWLAAKAGGFNSPAHRINLSRALLERAIQHADDPDVLAEAVRSALKLAPESPVLLKLKARADFLTGMAAAEREEWDTALRAWLSARRYSPVPRQLVANIALAYERLEQWTEAAEAWREFIRRRPRRGESSWSPMHIARLWQHIDVLYSRDGHFAQAAASLRYAIKAQPDDLSLRVALVKRYIENQNFRSAANVAARVLEAAPAHAEARTLYAQALELEGEIDAAIEAWERVDMREGAPFAGLARGRLSALYVRRAELYRGVEDMGAAAQDYGSALKLDPENNLLRARYAAALVSDDPAKAREAAKAVTLADDNATCVLIAAWHRAGQHAEAAQWRAARPPLPPARLVDLGAAIVAKAPQEAAGYFAAGLEGAPQSADDATPRLLTLIGAIYHEHAQSAAAYDHARRALKADSNYGPAHFHLALWDAGKGRRAAALDHLQKAAAWARAIRRTDVRHAFEEAIALLEEKFTPTLDEVLELIEGDPHEVNRLLCVPESPL